MNPKAKTSEKVLTVLLTSLPGKREEFVQTLEGLRNAIGKEPGCLDCLVAQDIAGETHFVLFMVWRDLKALEAILASEHFRILRGAMNVLTAPADFRFVSANVAVRS